MTSPHLGAGVALSPATASTAKDDSPLPQGVRMETPALVRTLVPLMVGGVVSALTTRGIEVSEGDEQLLSVGLTSLFAFVYWLLAHVLEGRWPLASLLLGSTAKPSYSGRHRKPSGDQPAPATPDAPETSR